MSQYGGLFLDVCRVKDRYVLNLFGPLRSPFYLKQMFKPINFQNARNLCERSLNDVTVS